MTTLVARCRAALSIVSLVVLGGCTEATGPGMDLPLARARWAANAPAAYRMTVEQSCFCGVDPAIEVVVRDGAVASLRSVATGEPVPAGHAAGHAGSVEELFDVIARAVEGRAARVEATFDRARGFPTRIVIDHQADAADDELFLAVRDFGPL